MSPREGVLAAALLAVGCAGQKYPPVDFASLPDPRRSEYVVGSGDRLAVVVWRNTELSSEAQVRPDGMITLPLVGDVLCAGRTPTQIRDELVRRLGTLFKAESLSVTVAVREVNSYKFTVTGHVERPGVIQAPAYVTAVEAIGLAGGPNRYASPDQAVLIRVDARGNTLYIPINYETLRDGSDLRQNVVVQRGDIIHVP